MLINGKPICVQARLWLARQCQWQDLWEFALASALRAAEDRVSRQGVVRSRAKISGLIFSWNIMGVLW